MNIPPYWARARLSVKDRSGVRRDLTAWGWSTASKLEAEQKAQERMRSIRAKVEAGEDLGRYGYGTRPLREEIIEKIPPGSSLPAAVITRNGYGSLVLNTRRAMFLDVDAPEVKPGLMERFLGRKGPDPRAEEAAKLAETLGTIGGGRFRIYRTAGGYRILATHKGYDPRESETEAIMKLVGADRAYQDLCRRQECFRARLTPKPWRCGHHLPPGQYPREEGEIEKDFAAWLSKYEELCRAKAVCRFLSEAGSGFVDPEVAPIVQLHDRKTRALEEAPLA